VKSATSPSHSLILLDLVIQCLWVRRSLIPVAKIVNICDKNSKYNTNSNTKNGAKYCKEKPNHLTVKWLGLYLVGVSRLLATAWLVIKRGGDLIKQNNGTPSLYLHFILPYKRKRLRVV